MWGRCPKKDRRRLRTVSDKNDCPVRQRISSLVTNSDQWTFIIRLRLQMSNASIFFEQRLVWWYILKPITKRSKILTVTDIWCLLDLKRFNIAVRFAKYENIWNLGDIADKRFRLLRSMLPFRGLSVCLPVCHVRALCSNVTSYWQDFSCTRQPHVFSISRQNLAYIGLQLPSQNFCPKVTSPPLIWASETFDFKLRPNG